MDFQALRPSWSESKWTNPLRCYQHGCQLLVPAVSVSAAAAARAPWVLEGPWKAEPRRIALQGLAPGVGCCIAARGRMKLKKADGWPGQVILHHLFPSPHRDSIDCKEAIPLLVRPLPAASFSLSTANVHLNICSEVPRHTFLSPHPLWSDRWQNSTLSYVMEPLNLSYSQGTALRIMARASTYQWECLSVWLTFRLKQIKSYLSLSAFLTWRVLKCNLSIFRE